MTPDDRQALIQAFLAGDLDEARTAAFEEILREDPSLAASLRVQVAMDTLLRVKAGRAPVREEMLANLSAAIAAQQAPTTRRPAAKRLLNFRLVLIAAAACLVLAVTLRVATVLQQGGAGGVRHSLAAVTSHQGKVLASGERRGQFQMSVGDRLQTVSLDSQATLEFPLAEASVRVAAESLLALDGQPSSPLILLEAGAITVQAGRGVAVRTEAGEVFGALGTWQVEWLSRPAAMGLPVTRDGEAVMLLRVDEGEVAIGNGAGQLRVGPGLSAWMAAGEQPRLVESPSVSQTTLPAAAQGFQGTVRARLHQSADGASQVQILDIVSSLPASQASQPDLLLGRRLPLQVPADQALPSADATGLLELTLRLEGETAILQP